MVFFVFFCCVSEGEEGWVFCLVVLSVDKHYGSYVVLM